MRLVEKADDLYADAARQTDPHKQKKTLDSARKNYSTALRKFAQAIELQPGMYQAWNYLGYSQRKLGNYQDALTAYDRALSIKPICRGHRIPRACVSCLNRLSEAKESYPPCSPAIASWRAVWLAMQEWVGARADAAGVDVGMPTVRVPGERAQQDRRPDGGLTREGATSA